MIQLAAFRTLSYVTIFWQMNLNSILKSVKLTIVDVMFEVSRFGVVSRGLYRYGSPPSRVVAYYLFCAPSFSGPLSKSAWKS